MDKLKNETPGLCLSEAESPLGLWLMQWGLLGSGVWGP